MYDQRQSFLSKVYIPGFFLCVQNRREILNVNMPSNMKDLAIGLNELRRFFPSLGAYIYVTSFFLPFPFLIGE
jgi:hypothetical protein